VPKSFDFKNYKYFSHHLPFRNFWTLSTQHIIKFCRILIQFYISKANLPKTDGTSSPNGLLQYAAVVWPSIDPNKCFTKLDVEKLLSIHLKLKENKEKLITEDNF